MPERVGLAVVLTGLFGLITFGSGCGKQVDKAPFVAAIDKWYDGQHICVWPEPTKLPLETDPTKDERVRGYDALTDAGLLMRELVEKATARPLRPNQ